MYSARLPSFLRQSLNLFNRYNDNLLRLIHGGGRLYDCYTSDLYENLIRGGFKRQLIWYISLEERQYPSGAGKLHQEPLLGYLAAFYGHVGLAKWLLRNSADRGHLRQKHHNEVVGGCIDSGHILHLTEYDKMSSIPDWRLDVAMREFDERVLGWFLLRRGPSCFVSRVLMCPLIPDSPIWAWLLVHLPRTSQAEICYRAVQYDNLLLIHTAVNTGFAYNVKELLEVCAPGCLSYVKSLPGYNG